MATREGSRRIAVVAALAAATTIAAIGWLGTAGSKAAGQHAAKTATVQTKTLKKLGTVLVNSKGLTLYMFVPDKRKKVTCTSQACVIVWPPLKIKSGQSPTAGGAARKKLLGTDKSPKGYRVVTYNRWPLYTYYLDKKPGQAKGQGVNNSGGKWYVLSPAGAVIKK
jgi:predicted lipoprotein with Yx(FWY)xxD motif